MATQNQMAATSEFGGVPAVRLNALIARRVFVPLELVRGNDVPSLYSRLKSGESFAVYWLHSIVDKKTNKIKDTWVKAEKAQDNRLPCALWRDSYFEWNIPADGSSAPHEVEPQTDPHFPIEVSLIVAGANNDECGLSIAWNPALGDVSGLVVTENNPELTALAMLRGKRIIHLKAKKIAILPLGGDIAPADPPDRADIIQELGKPFGLRDKRWHLRPRPTCFYIASPDRHRDDRAVLSVDFGTSSSTVSILNVKNTGTDPLGDVGLIQDLSPWTHSTMFPNHAVATSPGHIAAEVKTYGSNEHWRGVVIAAPPHIVKHRTGWSCQKTARVASLLYALDDHAGEAVTLHKEDAIGNEADQAFDKNLRDPKRKDWRRFLFSPKKRLGLQNNELLARDGEHPIELYLRELFDQAMHTRLLELGSKAMVKIDKVAYSYPVTWTRDQRNQYRDHLERALNKSFISELTDKAARGGGLLDDAYAMDEASAAFLGFLLERFNGLRGDQLVDVFQPFDPSPASITTYPKSINALIFDCGEGTTDLVLLRITDSGELTKPVDSNVLHHFAMDKAGLEVTRRVAERLKEYLKNANSGNEKDLRTNLQDPASELDEYQAEVKTANRTTDHPMSKESYRRTLIYAIMKEAERLKLELTSGNAQINWSEIIRLSGLNTPSERDLESADLVNIVTTIFSPAAAIIQHWLAKDISLNAILMSGRSSQLPGLKELISNSIPPGKGPFEIDFVRPGSFRLHSNENGYDESSKTAVCKGLAMNFWNRSGHNTRALMCHPIDEKLRARAIGVLAMDVALRPLASFDPRYPLLVDSDNEPVRPQEDLLPLVSHNPTSRGFYLGINFAGRALSSALDDADSPQPFCHVRIENGSDGAYKELRFVFRQISATEVRLAYVELERVDGNVEKKELQKKEDLGARVDFGELKISLVPYRVDEDARVTGRIHIDGANPLDHDR
jgi:hypothetical protein